MKMRLHYWVSNGGDGSANVLFDSKEQAEKDDEDQQENGEGWGENSSGSVVLEQREGVWGFVKSAWPEPEFKRIDTFISLELVEA